MENINKNGRTSYRKATLRRLCRVRRSIALKEGVTVHCVLPNQTLHHICERAPKNQEELKALPGIGPLALRYSDLIILKIGNNGLESEFL